MPSNTSVIKIGNSHIQHNIEQEGKIKQRKIQTIGLGIYYVLHGSIYAENPKRLYQ
jgi:predicted acyltransferase (DUF342 family)